MAAVSKTLAILFVGNSYTNRNDLPGLVEKLSLAGGPSCRVETARVIANGMSLRTHWNRGIATKLIRSRRWDFVVLQDQSTMGLRNPERLKEYVGKFDVECRANGAKTALYLTWARKHMQERQGEITAAYAAAAQGIGAIVVPVGVAWQKVRQLHPKLALHTWDRSHPTKAGSYLAACVFYATLIGQNPVGLPAIGVTGEEAGILQRVAWDARDLGR